MADATQLFRIGHGYDLHRLQPGGFLMLGGVRVSDATRNDGARHSYRRPSPFARN